MANSTYLDFMDAVASYYGFGSDAWARIAQIGVTPETLPLIQQIPGVSVTLSNSGNVLGYDISNAFASSIDPASVIDSNIQTGLFSNGAFNANVPATVITDIQTHENTLVSGLKTTTGGLTVAAVADKVNLGVLGVSLGTKLGAAIDSTLYNLNPNFWDEHLPTLNPETWDTMASTEGGKSLIRSIFGINNNNSTMYINEKMLAYVYQMMLKEECFSKNQVIPDPLPNGTVVTVSSLSDPFELFDTIIGLMPNGVDFNGHKSEFESFISSHGNGYYSMKGSTFDRFQGSSPINIYFKSLSVGSNVTIGDRISGVTLSCYGVKNSGQPLKIMSTSVSSSSGSEPYYQGIRQQSNEIQCSNLNVTSVPVVVGVNDNPNANIHVNPNNIINPNTNLPITYNDNINDVIQALKTAYPDLFTDSIYEDVMQPDGTVERITYIPTPFPDQDTNGNPITDMTPNIDPQINPEINPENRPSPYLQNFTDTVTTNPEVPDTGSGEISPIITPTGEGSSLWAIYNPTQTELNNFGAWLWSSTFVEQIKKLFNDPMQAIIGVHKVFATPSTGASANIKCGYIDSGVSAKTVTNQYSSVNCGSVNLYEYFGNVFDYDPFTKVEIFLPFIGIVPLNLDYIMRSQITVKYTVDVLSGACIANIKVNRDGYGSVLFTYGGSAIVTYPISSGSYMGMVSGALSLLAGVVGTVASGGALAPAMLGAASGIGRMKTDVQHSGQFSGACGAMGAKKPYLIISRPQTRVADNVNQYEGIPSNTNVQLSECTGYTKVKTVHLSIPGAYDSEIQEIEQLLKDGIII